MIVPDGHDLDVGGIGSSNALGCISRGAVDGMLVRPGDLVVADGDGVVVAPIEIAEDVASTPGSSPWATEPRGGASEKVGLPLDNRVVDPESDTE